ncbi:MAG: 3'-5' exonuclease, partial [bacterium]
GQTALRRLTDIIADARGDQGRLPLRQWIEGIWLSLGGAAILELPIEEDAAESYFELLEEHEHAGDIVDFAAFDQALERLFAPPDPAASDQVQLMTIHKSKGLQFDTVILPGLGKSARNEDKRLLEWQLRPNRHGNTDLLTAPIHGTGDPDDDSYRYLRSIEKQKTDQEVCRLLYVATTRARQALHLFGHVTWNDKKETCNPPASGSLLASLWPAVKSQFEQLSPDELQQQEQAPVCINTIKRLPVDWQLSELPVQLIKTDTPPVTSSETTIEFDWAGETARHTGTLIHRYLERMAHEGPSHWSAQRLINQQDAMRTALTNLGVAEEELNTAVDKTRSGLINALADPRGQWILTNHSQASSELALTAITPEGPKTYVIDRTFVDNEGKRWIIDYKTGGHQGGQLEQFLDQEQQRYREQLESYGELFASQSEHPVMLALYFPVTGGWREWPLPTESVE